MLLLEMTLTQAIPCRDSSQCPGWGSGKVKPDGLAREPQSFTPQASQLIASSTINTGNQ